MALFKKITCKRRRDVQASEKRLQLMKVYSIFSITISRLLSLIFKPTTSIIDRVFSNLLTGIVSRKLFFILLRALFNSSILPKFL